MTSIQKTNNLRYRNLKLAYILAIIIIILLGLASRKYSDHLLSFIAENSGDMLWAMMVYFGFRFLLVNKNMLTAVILSFLFSYAIELSQLYQEVWINQIRGTTFGALILGKGFLAVDLIRYTAGIIIGTVLDKEAFHLILQR